MNHHSSPILVLSLWLGAATAGLIPFPFPVCESTTTVSLDYTTTSTITVTLVTGTVTITGPPVISIDTVTTTVFTPTSVPCLIGETTLGASSLPISTPASLSKRDDPASTPAPTPAPDVSINEIRTIYQPCLPGAPCTDFILESEITTTTVSRASTTTITPTVIGTVTEIIVIPTPTVYRGVNYFQYRNDYHYPDGSGQGCANCGFGGGNYDTADWNGNYSYYTNGTTQNINFQSQNYPSWDTMLCQLPGQAAPSDCSQWTVVFQGYLHATQFGNYTLTAGSVDNALFWWTGQKAYSSYTNANVDGGISYVQPPGVPTSVRYDMVPGQFLPITLIFVNGAGPARNLFGVRAPDGTDYPGGVGIFVPPCPGSPFVP
ncbi:hypothetical protein DL769_002520 [Monosporascus sp. CRB-8-3]|nr:hypothetical protein DL769_002520 [Monosporascus sp. CRB-8-3]